MHLNLDSNIVDALERYAKSQGGSLTLDQAALRLLRQTLQNEGFLALDTQSSIRPENLSAGNDG